MAHSWRIAIVVRNHRTAFCRNTFTSVIAVHMMRFFGQSRLPPATLATCSQRLAISPTSNQNPPTADFGF
jgi:hypothetical protein